MGVCECECVCYLCCYFVEEKQRSKAVVGILLEEEREEVEFGGDQTKAQTHKQCLPLVPPQPALMSVSMRGRERKLMHLVWWWGSPFALLLLPPLLSRLVSRVSCVRYFKLHNDTHHHFFLVTSHTLEKPQTPFATWPHPWGQEGDYEYIMCLSCICTQTQIKRDHHHSSPYHDISRHLCVLPL